MDESALYLQIAAEIREEILAGALHPGDRLPSVRAMAARWKCTLGTVQHAYRELAHQGLVASRAGQGTRVSGGPPAQNGTSLRRATLVHRAESFLLEVLAAGYSAAELEEAVRLALGRWRDLQAPRGAGEHVLRFAGSDDLAVAWLGTRFPELAPPYELQLDFTGSLGGLMALAEGRADLAGSHLWDAETGTYNVPFVRRLFPGRRIALVTLANRQIGLIVPPGNPAGIGGLRDVARRKLRFANRQPGSGTRVWLDLALRRLHLRPEQIAGYDDERHSHAEVARAVAEGQADAGLGLQASARALNLGFVPLTQECYQFVVPAETLEHPAVRQLVRWLRSHAGRQAIAALGGYDTHGSGSLTWVE